MPWEAVTKTRFLERFNEMADQARAEDRWNDEPSTVWKEMTRLLQFIPPIDVIEKVTVYLLGRAGVQADQYVNHTDEQLVEKLAGVNIDAIMDAFDFQSVPADVTQAW